MNRRVRSPRHPAERAGGCGRGLQRDAGLPVGPGRGRDAIHRQVVPRRAGVLPLRAQGAAQHEGLLTNRDQC